MSKDTRACGIASEASSAVTASANRAAASVARVRQRLRQSGQFGPQRVPLGGQLADPLVVAVQLGEPRRRSPRPRPARRRCPRRTCGSARSARPAAPRPPPAAADRRPGCRRTRRARPPRRRAGCRSPRSGRRARPAPGRGTVRRPGPAPAPATSVVASTPSGSSGLPGERGVGGTARRRPAPPRARAAPPPRPAPRPRRRAARRPRSRSSPKRSRSASWARSRARVVDLVELDGDGPQPPVGGSRTWRAARRPRRPRTGRGPAAAGGACSSPCWSVCPCTATSSSASSASMPTGTDRPPRCARERPSAETVRLISSAPSSSSAPASSARTAAGAPAGTVIRPSTTAVLAPIRTRAGSARPPSSSPRLVTTMVLPAPVSPVTAVKPGDSSTTASSMTPSDRIRISSNTDTTLRGPGPTVRRPPALVT